MNIFIPCARADRERVTNLASLLRAGDLQVYPHADEPSAGDHWLVSLRQRIDAAESVVSILSEKALRSPTTMFELGAAKAARKRVLPLFVSESGQETEIPREIAGSNFVRVQSPQEAAEQVKRCVSEQMAMA